MGRWASIGHLTEPARMLSATVRSLNGVSERAARVFLGNGDSVISSRSPPDPDAPSLCGPCGHHFLRRRRRNKSCSFSRHHEDRRAIPGGRSFIPARVRQGSDESLADAGSDAHRSDARRDLRARISALDRARRAHRVARDQLGTRRAVAPRFGAIPAERAARESAAQPAASFRTTLVGVTA